MTKKYDVDGIASSVEFGKNGPRIKDSSGLLQARDNADTVFVRMQGADSVVDDDLVTRRQLLASGGSLAGKSGNIYEDLQAYIDSADRNSYPGSGSTVTDILGNATSGSIVAPASFSEGAFQFNGTSGRIAFTKGAALDDIWDGGGTALCFFRPNTDGEAGVGRFLDTSGGGGAGWTALTDNQAPDGTMRVRFIQSFSGVNGDWETTDTPLQRDTWNSVAVVYDSSSTGNVPSIYVNTSDEAISTNSSPTGSFDTDAGNPLNIGNRTADDRTTDGEIAIVLMFDRELSHTEIIQIHNLFQTRFPIGFRGKLARAAGVEGARYLIAGGDYTLGGSTSGSNGGDVEFRGGNTNSTNSSSSGGGMRVVGGNSDGGPGGPLTARSGDGLLGAAAEFGAGDITSGGNTAADCTIHGGDNLGTGAGGDFIARAGAGGTTGSGNGGDAALIGGQPETLGNSGDVILRTVGPNSGTTGKTGDIRISTEADATTGPQGPTGGTDTNTGDILLTTQNPGATADETGSIALFTGNCGGSSGAGPGNIAFATGSGTAGSFDGGDIAGQTGDGSGTGRGGDITWLAGEGGGTDRNGRHMIRTDGTSEDSGVVHQTFQLNTNTTGSTIALNVREGMSVGEWVSLRVQVVGHEVSTGNFVSQVIEFTAYRVSGVAFNTQTIRSTRSDTGTGAWIGATVTVSGATGDVLIRVQADVMSAVNVDWTGWCVSQLGPD